MPALGVGGRTFFIFAGRNFVDLLGGLAHHDHRVFTAGALPLDVLFPIGVFGEILARDVLQALAHQREDFFQNCCHRETSRRDAAVLSSV